MTELPHVQAGESDYTLVNPAVVNALIARLNPMLCLRSGDGVIITSSDNRIVISTIVDDDSDCDAIPLTPVKRTGYPLGLLETHKVNEIVRAINMLGKMVNGPGIKITKSREKIVFEMADAGDEGTIGGFSELKEFSVGSNRTCMDVNEANRLIDYVNWLGRTEAREPLQLHRADAGWLLELPNADSFKRKTEGGQFVPQACLFPVTDNSDDQTPDIFRLNSKPFRGGRVICPGKYRVEYVTGCMCYHDPIPPFVRQWSVNYPSVVNTYTVTYYDSPTSQLSVPAPGDDTLENTQAAAIADSTGLHVDFDHYGGVITVNFYDSPYNDNVAGDVNPTFRLVYVGPL